VEADEAGATKHLASGGLQPEIGQFGMTVGTAAQRPMEKACALLDGEIVNKGRQPGDEEQREVRWWPDNSLKS
jgi:hypothetical protein